MGNVRTDSQLSNAAEPLVSFVIPAYNEATHFPETFRRIRDLETELPTRRSSSTGEARTITRFLAAAYDAIVIDQEDSGIGAARHQGAEHARGEFYAFVDADTELDRTYLDSMLGFVSENDLVAASSRCELTGSRRAVVPQLIHNYLFPRSDRPILPGFNTFVHREAYAAAGGLPEPPERGQGAQPPPRRRRDDGPPPRRPRSALRAARRRTGPFRDDATLRSTRGHLPRGGGRSASSAARCCS